MRQQTIENVQHAIEDLKPEDRQFNIKNDGLFWAKPVCFTQVSVYSLIQDHPSITEQKTLKNR